MAHPNAEAKDAIEHATVNLTAAFGGMTDMAGFAGSTSSRMT
jgi:hypothetical protein